MNEETHSDSVILSASGLVQGSNGVLRGLFISAIGTTPTITVYDNTAASGTVIVPTFTPTANQSVSFPYVNFNTGCYVAIGGTGTTTVAVYTNV